MSQLSTNTADLQTILAQVNALPDEKKIQDSKSVTPTTSQQTVTPDSGYDGLSQVTVSPIPSQYQDVTTPLAELNSVNGGTVAETISAAVDNTESYTGTQENKLEELKVILQGKAAGEDVSEETEEYTSLLTDLETAIDALPDAGSGGGVETCTLTVGSPDGPITTGMEFAYATTSAMERIEVDLSVSTSYIIAKNSLVFCRSSMIMLSGAYVQLESPYGVAFYITGDCTITFTG